MHNVLLYILPTDTQLVVVAVAHNYSAVYTSAYVEHAMWLGGKPKVQENGLLYAL